MLVSITTNKKKCNQCKGKAAYEVIIGSKHLHLCTTCKHLLSVELLSN